MAINRKDLQALALARVLDAEVLFKNRRYDAAYYLAGYAIECALKACIAKKTRKHDFADKHLAAEAYTHELSKLLKLSEIDLAQDQFRKRPLLERKWTTVQAWRETSRYEKHGRRQAEDMLEAVAGNQGVLECIKEYW